MKVRKRKDEKPQWSRAEQTPCRSKCVSGSIKMLEGKQKVGGATQQGAEVRV